MDHIEVTKRAIDFTGPAYLPMEALEVPGIYDGYGALTLMKDMLPGTEDFDVLSVTYSWQMEEIGVNEEGMPLKRDEWGVEFKIPPKDYAYLVVKEPLKDWDNIKNYKWPDPSITDGFFKDMEKRIAPYRDRFIFANNDPGPFLIAINMRGFEDLLMDIQAEPEKAMYLMEQILEYQLELVKKWQAIGAHAIAVFDTWGTQKGTLVHPETWRKHFKPYYRKYFDAIHAAGMYASFEGDGDYAEILEDLCDVGLDILDLRQCSLYDLNWMAKVNGGKMCVKATVDMTNTLALGTPDDVRRDVDNLYNTLGSRNGGLICLCAEWPDYKYSHENIMASVEAFNKYRNK